MAGVESKPRQVITPMPDADPILGPTAPVVVRYLASFAMTAVATAVAVGRDGPSCTETSVQGPARFVRQSDSLVAFAILFQPFFLAQYRRKFCHVAMRLL